MVNYTFYDPRYILIIIIFNLTMYFIFNTLKLKHYILLFIFKIVKLYQICFQLFQISINIGKYKWKNGNTFEGEWKKDKRNGQGVKFWLNGDKYIGEWKND